MIVGCWPRYEEVARAVPQAVPQAAPAAARKRMGKNWNKTIPRKEWGNSAATGSFLIVGIIHIHDWIAETPRTPKASLTFEDMHGSQRLQCQAEV